VISKSSIIIYGTGEYLYKASIARNKVVILLVGILCLGINPMETKWLGNNFKNFICGINNPFINQQRCSVPLYPTIGSLGKLYYIFTHTKKDF